MKLSLKNISPVTLLCYMIINVPLSVSCDIDIAKYLANHYISIQSRHIYTNKSMCRFSHASSSSFFGRPD